MAQEGYDKLLSLTDSRYRLSMVVARRAAQLKLGIPTFLTVDELPPGQNTVTLAMKELEIGDQIKWGDDLPAMDELRRAVEPKRVETPSSYTPMPDDDDDDLRD
ncbi:MAG: DNA-directed RNA polymerase subunit omega [Trueperaceae bacterium]|nr:DNA-directed RNA polymerase subunit omega [Trueperaceae bacterium]